MSVYQIITYVPPARPDRRHATRRRIFETWEAAEDYALFGLILNPDLLVAWVELETSTCRHCDLPIIENAGWVIYRWIHVKTNFYVCRTLELTMAEPKEDV